MKEKARYVREKDKKKTSAASVIAILAFITGAAFFALGIYLTMYPELGEEAVAAVLGWIALLVFILGIIIEILSIRVNKKIYLLDRCAMILNGTMTIAIIAVYIWGLLS